MQTAERMVLTRATRRHGVIVRVDALAAGMPQRTIDARLEAGAWIRIDEGAYGVSGTPLSWRQRLLAACANGRAWASHRSATALYGLPYGNQTTIEVTAPHGGQRSLQPVRWHESRVLPPGDLVVVDGIPCTSPGRTIVDLAAVMGPMGVEEALDAAVRAGHLSNTDFAEDVIRLAAKGRRGSRALRRILGTRDSSSSPESVLETRFLVAMRRRGLPAPVTQYEVWDGSRFVARIDCAYPAAKLGIEVKGARWHSSRLALDRDAQRERALLALGWRIVTVTATDLRERGDAVARDITRALRGPAPFGSGDRNYVRSPLPKGTGVRG